SGSLDGFGRLFVGRRRILGRNSGLAFTLIVLEAAVALLAAALPALAAAFATAALAALAVRAGVRALAVTVAIGLAFGAFGLTAGFVFQTALLSLLGGDDGGGLGARLVLEVDVEALAGLFALRDLADRALGLKRAQDAE